MLAKEHWDQIYRTKPATEVSWFQPEPALSLRWIMAATDQRARVIDVGGGASLLVDRLLDNGYENVAVLDISQVALDSAKRRLGERAAKVRWINADITAAPNLGNFDLWHDRGVFHFLTDADDRRKYIETAARTIVPGGTMILATFAPNGPQRCSGLNVQRWSGTTLSTELAPRFRIVEETTEVHLTPQGTPQEFAYSRFVRRHDGN